jgi:hypothetical protein
MLRLTASRVVVALVQCVLFDQGATHAVACLTFKAPTCLAKIVQRVWCHRLDIFQLFSIPKRLF